CRRVLRHRIHASSRAVGRAQDRPQEECADRPDLPQQAGAAAVPPADCACSALGISMRIAQVAPLYESFPPRLYGGTERVVSYLTEELVRLGHDVTLYASGDSRTGARLKPICDRALRLSLNRCDPLAYHTVQLGQVAKDAPSYDVIHFHTDYL